ncbi:MAG: glycosyltransferase family 4 protein [Alphaproteobacteria bacterium]|nr:glycosyltransferase family 4 protein [Alphaproteobacteria bacterium]
MARGKILYVINHPDWFWSHRLPLALGAKNAGYQVQIAMPGGATDRKLKEYGFEGFDLPSFETKTSLFAVFKTLLSLQKMLQKEKPQIVHAITLKYAFMTGLVARFHGKLRVVLTIAGLGYLFSGEGIKPKMLRILISPFLELALKNPRATIIFQNPDDLELLVKRGFVRKKQAVLIRGSGVDTEIFKPSETPPEEPPIVLMPTRLIRDKGIAIFIEAAKILKQQGSDARFQIAGGLSPGSPGAVTEQEMKTLLADSPVEWLGKVTDMPGLLARAALIAYPSYYREGVPKALLEAAASGRAIVTTDHPGCREAVSDRINGLLVPVRDPEATAESLQMLLQNPVLRAEMEQAGREKACREFDVRLVVENTLKTYEK